MITPLVEKLFISIKAKGHINPLLPDYNLTCVIVTGKEKIYFSLSKTNLAIIDDVERVDVKIEGSLETVRSIISGHTALRKSDIVFAGSFRHQLLLDSIFSLCRDRENSLTEENLVM
ncbi:hypothetical protein [Bacillus alkalisoli]|uniref:hypothetical protein n=1 Tax=Bacillus alkalisoli TaxID=2011008 RepID=UPI000C2355C4|nr:hypothetical protein [Bacillus alkalisoli]